MAHIEVMPLGSLEDQLQHLAAGSTITVTCSPKRGIDATVRVAALLSERGLDAVSSPEGEFDSALQLLQAMSNCDHGVTEIGVAVYLEGHPFIDNETLTDALRAKQEFATNCVTQLCFSGDTITNWIDSVRDQGISLPVRVGLAGAVERKKLFAFSLRIGVGESARFSMKQPKIIEKLLAAKTYQPDDLVPHLANFVDNPRFNICGPAFVYLQSGRGNE